MIRSAQRGRLPQLVVTAHVGNSIVANAPSATALALNLLRQEGQSAGRNGGLHFFGCSFCSSDAILGQSLSLPFR